MRLNLNVRKHSRSKRSAVRFVVVCEEFVFQFRHVDVRRTLGFASFALEAKIERIVKILSGEVVCRQFARKDLAHEVRASTRGVLVLQRDHVRRAHRAFILLPANAGAIA